MERFNDSHLVVIGSGSAECRRPDPARRGRRQGYQILPPMGLETARVRRHHAGQHHPNDAERFAKAALPRFEMLKAGRCTKTVHLAAFQRRDAYQPASKQEVEDAVGLITRDYFNYGSGIIIQVPSAPSRTITPFKGLLPSVDELATLMDDALSSIAISHTAREETPPLPLKQGHIALQLACGHFNGAVGTGEHRHVVKGRVVRTPSSREETDDNGNTVTVTEETLSVAITAIDQTGVCRRFSSKGEE